MSQKERSPGAATPRLQESKKIVKGLSRFQRDFNLNQDAHKKAALAYYYDSLAVAEAEPSHENMRRWHAALQALPPNTLTPRRVSP